MATFFGEVILPSSRAFFDDCDDSDIDEDDCTSRVELEFTKQPEGDCSTSNVLFIVDGPLAIAFSKVGLLSYSDKVIVEVGAIRTEPRDTFDLMNFDSISNRPEPVKIFALENNNLLLQISSAINVMNANDLLMMLKEWFVKCNKVVVIASRPNAVFRCESTNDIPMCFVRCLNTSVISQPEHIKHLDQPNYLSDFPAAVMSWCEAAKRPAVLLAVYSDRPQLDKISLNLIASSLTDMNLAPTLLNCESRGDELENMDRTFMYM